MTPFLCPFFIVEQIFVLTCLPPFLGAGRRRGVKLARSDIESA